MIPASGLAATLVLHLVLLSACCGRSVGLNVPDSVHYLARSPDGRESISNGGLIERWLPSSDKVPDFTLTPPVMTKFTLPVGVAFPEEGGTYWLDQEAAYVVLSGSGVFNTSDGSERAAVAGDVYYSAAGLPHGFANKGSSPLVVVATTAYNFSWISGPPSAVLPEKSKALIGQGFWATSSATQWIRDPQTNTDFGIWKPKAMLPGAMAIRVADSAMVPRHYHPEGVLYIIVSGQLVVAGDSEQNATLDAGDMRWARPGFAYGPEWFTGARGETLMIVFGAPPRMVFEDSPPQETFTIRKATTLQVSYPNTQHAQQQLLQQQQQQQQQQQPAALKSTGKQLRHIKRRLLTDQEVEHSDHSSMLQHGSQKLAFDDEEL